MKANFKKKGCVRCRHEEVIIMNGIVLGLLSFIFIILNCKDSSFFVNSFPSIIPKAFSVLARKD